MERDEIASMLQRLNMQVAETDEGWQVTPPSYRFDINIEADLIEEIGRLIGYNNIPGSREASHIRMDSFPSNNVEVNRIRDILVEQGYFEAVTYSFVSPEMQALLDPGQATLPLANPISSDMSVMRTRCYPAWCRRCSTISIASNPMSGCLKPGLCFVPSEAELAADAAHCGGDQR